MDRFLDLLNSVKRKNNSTFSSCEPELIELMRQIDEMIELKNKEWKHEMECLETQMEHMNNENQILIKDSDYFRSLLSEEKKAHSLTLSQYEKDVRQLKDDMGRLKKKYLDLQKKIEHTKKKRQQELNADNLCKAQSTIIKDSEPTNSQLKEDLTEKCANLEKENFILKLKMESVMVENSNLRYMLREQSEPLVKKKSRKNTIDFSPADDLSTVNSSDSDTFTNNHPDNHKHSMVSSGTVQSKYENTSINTILDNQSYKKTSTNVSGSIEYFDEDKSLEEKLNNVISQFETVSSSMIAM